MFPGAHATSHSGWIRVTDLDGKFLAYTSGNGGGTGGSASHTHSEAGAGHTHTQVQHRHTFSGGTNSGNVNIVLGLVTFASTTHTHAAANSNYATATNQNTISTLGATTNLPSYIDVIFKKSDGTTDIPDGFWAWFDSSSTPTGWSIPAGPKNRYVRGAAASGDGGGTGGAVTHTHSAVAHTHTQDTHGHASATSAGTTGTTKTGTNTQNDAVLAHTHTVSLDTLVAVNQNATIATISTDADEPVYEKLLLVQNDTGGGDTPDGIIGIWLEDATGIPAGWARKTITGDFIKCANDATEIGNTGGALTHTHTDTDDGGGHVHTQTAHSHAGTRLSTSDSKGDRVSGVTAVAAVAHNHTWTSSSVAATNNGAVVTFASCSSKAAYPAYYEIILIKKQASDEACYLPVLGAG